MEPLCLATTDAPGIGIKTTLSRDISIRAATICLVLANRVARPLPLVRPLIPFTTVIATSITLAAIAGETTSTDPIADVPPYDFVTGDTAPDAKSPFAGAITTAETACQAVKVAATHE